VNRLYAGLAAFVALGVLAWTTLSDPRIRLATLAILVMFAVKTWVRRNDVAQLVEHSLGKGEVISSILIIGSRIWRLQGRSELGLCRVRGSQGRAGVTQW
jgi:hypothetical protein